MDLIYRMAEIQGYSLKMVHILLCIIRQNRQSQNEVKM